MQKVMQKFMKCRAVMLKKVNEAGWELLTLAVVIVSLFFWISQKEGYHMDELLSFELSNAEYNPWIVPTQPEGRLAKFMREEIRGDGWGETFENILKTVEDVWENRGNSVLAGFRADVYEEPVWIDRQMFYDYITVSARDAFNYLSVYFNVKDDNHPPVHFMALHTVSSLLRGSVNPWMGCVINVAAVTGVCVLLMIMGRMLCGDRNYGIMAALLYGMSGGAVATVLLIRMYGMMTFFCVCTLYLHLKKWKAGNWRKENKPLIAVTVLGFLTQYFFLFYAIGLAVVTILFLGVRKKGKEVFFYIRSMCIAAVIGIGLFPFAISHVLSSDRGVEAFQNLAQGLGGYSQRLAEFGKILAERFSGGIIGIAVLMLSFAAAGYICRKREDREGEGRDGVDREGRIPVTALLAAPFAIYFLLAAKMSPYLVDRYIMPIFPIAALLAVYAAKKYRLRGKAGVACALILGILSVVSYDGEYTFRGYESQVEIARRYRGLPCVCVYEGYGYYKNLIEFKEYRETLLVKADELEKRQKDEVLDAAEQVIVMVKGEIDQEWLKELLWKKYGYTVLQELLSSGVHQDSIWLCTR